MFFRIPFSTGWIHRTAVALQVTVVLRAGPASAQEMVISGRVTGRGGTPLAGATVALAGRPAAITGPTGTFVLTVHAAVDSGATGTLVARMIGYRPSSREIRLVAGPQQQDFVLESDPLHLEELVVTGVSDAMSTKKLPFSVGVVTAENIQSVPGVTALEALSGRVAGVSMLQSSGVPGAPPAIRIRGYTSIYSTPQPPLLIIDGTITRMTLSDVSGEDIARLEVLKGAAATSYYGSDAANGVIQIFTRRGTSQTDGRLTATARFEAGTGFVTRRPPLSQHHNYQLDPNGDFLRAADGTRIAEDDLIMDNPYPIYYDQYGLVIRNALFYSASMALSQRKGNTSFFASFQQMSNSGLYELQDGFSRQNYRLNLDQGLTPQLDLSLNLFYGRSRSAGQEMAATWGGGIDLMWIEPHLDITGPNADGTPYNNQLPDQEVKGTWNPLYSLDHNTSTNDRERFTGGGRLRWRPATWLGLEGQFNYDSEGSQRFDQTDYGTIQPNGDIYDGWMARSWLSGRSYNTGVTATGTWHWRRITNTTRLAFVYEDQYRTELSADGGRYIMGGVRTFAATDPAQTTADAADYTIRTQNLYGVTTFDVADRYILDALIRKDGSSLFGEDNRWSTYFRVSGAWRVTEDFHLPGVEELKLRASYGTAGLRPGFNYQYELLTSQDGAIVKQSLGNPQLKPARSGEFEVGANLAFGGSRYALEYNYSRKETTDQIVQQNLPAVSGFSTQWVNAGVLLTRTHELTLAMQPVQRRDLSLTLNVTADRMRSVITEWPLPDQRGFFGWYREGEDLGILTGWRFTHTIEELYHDPAKAAQSGPGQYWSRDSVMVNELGHVVRRSVWRTPAEKPIIYRTCGNPPVCSTSDEFVVLGRADPDFTLNLASTLAWKRLSLSAVVYWWQGGQIANWDLATAIRGQRSHYQDQSASPVEERKSVNYFVDYGVVDEPLLEPATFLKLRELALSYTLGSRQLRTVGLGRLEEVRLGIAGRNLFTFTGYTGWDPEVGGAGAQWDSGWRPATGDPFRVRAQSLSYPNPRTVTATVEIAF